VDVDTFVGIDFTWVEDGYCGSFLSSVFKYLVIKVLKRICNMVFGGYIVIFNIKPPLFIRLSIGFINRKWRDIHVQGSMVKQPWLGYVLQFWEHRVCVKEQLPQRSWFVHKVSQYFEWWDLQLKFWTMEGTKEFRWWSLQLIEILLIHGSVLTLCINTRLIYPCL